MRLYIIRHADPDYPNNTITEAGHLEARALAKRLKREGIERIFCSPLGRARDTMQYTADCTALEATIEDWTQELGDLAIDTELDGRISIWDLPGEVYRGGTRIPAVDTWHTLEPLAGSRAQEKLEGIVRGSDDFLQRLGYERDGRRYRVVHPNRERVAVFCHMAFGLAWIAHLLELPLPSVWSSFWLPPSSVTTILMEERTPNWAVPRCIGQGDVSHLYESGLLVRPRGIRAKNW